MQASLQVRRLSAADAAAYCVLRRQAMEAPAYPLEPQVLREAETGAEGMATQLADYVANGTSVWGAFSGDPMIGTAALSREYHRSSGGIGVLWGVYVLLRYRGTPASRLLMERVIDCCGLDCTIDQILAACARDNVAGERFLRRFGFEPMSLLIRDGSIHGQGGNFVYLQRPVR